MFLITGWGRTSVTEPDSEKLLGVTVPWVSPEDCKNAYDYDDLHPITEQMMCTGHPDGEIGTCKGDSGGKNIYFSCGFPDMNMK